MKIRSDSPFAKLTEDQCDLLVSMSNNMSLQDLVKVAARGPDPIHCSVTAMSRFLRRAKEDKLLRDAEESTETVEAFAKRGETVKVREATLAAMRDRMFEAAVESNDRATLMEVFAALNAEKDAERMIEIEERKLKVAEENTRLGWRKIELENARSALKLLPKLRELLMDATKKAEERVAEALDCLGAEGRKLLAGIPEANPGDRAASENEAGVGSGAVATAGPEQKARDILHAEPLPADAKPVRTD